MCTDNQLMYLFSAPCVVDAITPLHMKALACAKVHTATTVLLVNARLLARALETLEQTNASASEISCSSQELRQELVLVEGLLAQQGMAPISTSLHGATDARAF